MQFIVISHQLWEAVVAVTLGVFFGFVYDLVRFFRRLFSHLRCEILIANIFDILYSVFCGASYCIFLYYASNGRFRWFTAAAAILGFVLYRLLPCRFIRPALYFIADKLLQLLSFAVYPLHLAARWIRKVFLRAVRAVLRRAAVARTEKMKKQLCFEVKLS